MFTILQALQNQNIDCEDVRQLRDKTHFLITNYDIRITMQWVPGGHAGIKDNEKADNLDTSAAQKPQPHRTAAFRTVKQIIRTNRTEWLIGWAQWGHRQAVFQIQDCPYPKRLSTFHLEKNKLASSGSE